MLSSITQIDPRMRMSAASEASGWRMQSLSALSYEAMTRLKIRSTVLIRAASFSRGLRN
jgi:hypothetical protein